jgi:hypothetical protein
LCLFGPLPTMPAGRLLEAPTARARTDREEALGRRNR